MQFFKLSYELINDTNITLSEYRIYTYLMSRYNAEKKCAYPSIEVISENTGVSIATIKRTIKSLSDKGYMIIEKKKGINGNYNTYKDFKHIIITGETKKSTSKAEVKPVKSETKSTPKVVAPAKEEVKKEIRKPLIVSDCKESGVQMEIEEISPYSTEHQQKISLVLKQNVKLTEKQQWLIGDMDLEMLRKAIFRFRKSTKTNTFAFLLECYFTECSLNGVEVSKDLQRYTGNVIVPVSNEYLENQRVKELMIEQGIFDEEAWNEYAALGI